MYQLQIEEYQVRDYEIIANGTKLSFRPRSIDQLIQGLALKIRGALHRSIMVEEFPEQGLITIAESDHRVSCELQTEDPKLRLLKTAEPQNEDGNGEGIAKIPTVRFGEAHEAWITQTPQEKYWLMVTHRNPDLLQARVNFLFSIGWETCGPLIMNHHDGTLTQTMRKS